MRNLIVAMFFTAGFSASGITVASAQTPKQMYNKTVMVSWSESAEQKGPRGVFSEQFNRSRVVYVSSAGRLFIKAETRGTYGGRSAEVTPGSSNTNFAFSGSRMIGHAVFAGFARQVVVSFDPAYASCSVSVTYGKSGGPRTWKSYDGKKTIELLALSVGSTSCSIRDGNALAS